MKRMKITFYDGSIQILTPNTDMLDQNKFNGDWTKLADTVARRAFPTTDSALMPNGKLYKKIDLI